MLLRTWKHGRPCVLGSGNERGAFRYRAATPTLRGRTFAA